MNKYFKTTCNAGEWLETTIENMLDEIQYHYALKVAEKRFYHIEMQESYPAGTAYVEIDGIKEPCTPDNIEFIFEEILEIKTVDESEIGYDNTYDPTEDEAYEEYVDRKLGV